MFKIKVLNIKLLISLFLIPIIFIYGINFGINGTDIYIYAEKNLIFLQQDAIKGPSPLFVLYVILLFSLGQGANPIAYLITGIVATFSSYLLVIKNNLKYSIISWTLFLLTLQGFNVSFNLIRTSFGILLVSLSYRVLNKVVDFKLRTNISLLIGTLGHIQTLIILLLFNLNSTFINLKKLIYSLKISKKVIIFSLIGVGILSFGTYLYSYKLLGYISRAILRKDIEIYKIALFYPLFFSLVTYVNIFKNKRFDKNENIFNREFVKSWIFIGWFAWIFSILGFPLIYERISVYALFFSLPLFAIKSNIFEYLLFTFTLFLRLSFIQ